MSTTLREDRDQFGYRAPAEPRTDAPLGAAESDELSDDDLEHVVGGLARTWAEALRHPHPAV